MLHNRLFLRQRGISKAEWVVLLAMIVIGAWIVAMMSDDIYARSRIAEERAAPLIAALLKYKAGQGAYPPELSALVPKYLPALPTCSENASGPIPYIADSKENKFWIVCPVGALYQVHGYDLVTGKWSTFDDTPLE
jgi:hypothetical protein